MQSCCYDMGKTDKHCNDWRVLGNAVQVGPGCGSPRCRQNPFLSSSSRRGAPVPPRHRLWLTMSGLSLLRTRIGGAASVESRCRRARSATSPEATTSLALAVATIRRGAAAVDAVLLPATHETASLRRHCRCCSHLSSLDIFDLGTAFAFSLEEDEISHTGS